MSKKKPILFAVAGVVVLGAAFVGYRWATEWRYIESTDNAYVASDMAPISPKVQGYVKTLAAGDNQVVRSGDVLLTIDDRDYAARVAEAQAAVDVARAALDGFDSRIVLQQSVIAQAQASVSSVDAEQNRAKLDLERMQRLAKEDFASRQKFESTDADARKAEAGVSRARAALAAERNQVAVRNASKREAEAKLRQAEAALASANNDLEGTVIRAPFDGTVGNRTVQVGQYLRPGTQAMVLVPLPLVYVVANFKETQLAQMAIGQSVELHVDSFPDHVLKGKVDSFAPASGARFSLLPPENATGNFTKIVQRVPVRIALEAGDVTLLRLRPGLSVSAAVDTRTGGAALAAAAH